MKRFATIVVFLLLSWSLPRHYTITIVKPVLAEYRSALICSDGNLRSYVNGSATMETFPLPGGELVADGVGGFNSYFVVSTVGHAYINYNDFTKNWSQFATDSAGTSINNAILPDAMGSNYLFIRSTDSSLYYGGTDDLNLLHTTGSGNYNFVKISGSLKIKKALIGYFRIVAMTTTGQVYEWPRGTGSITPVQKTLPAAGYALDIWVSHYDYAGCLIPNVGETSGYGHPYVWGSSFGAWQGSSSYSQPTAIGSTWGVTQAVKQVVTGWNTTHLIDSTGKMWGNAYCQTNGELGNGIEFANRYNYSQPYSWTLNDGENPSGATMVQIGAGITWQTLYNNAWFVFYNFAFDVSGKLYFWGADKSYVSMRGYNCLQSATYRNALDVTTPTEVNGLDSTYSTWNFTLPSLSAGSTQTVKTNHGTLTAAGHPALLINQFNSADTLAYRFVSFAWTCTAKPVGAATPTFGSASAQTTTVSGLQTGSYTFQVISTDNNGGTAIATVSWTVLPFISVPYGSKIVTH
jgi:hypothetical protein